MRKFLKFLLISLGTLTLLAILALVGVYWWNHRPAAVSKADLEFMELAFKEAEQGLQKHAFPVGAVVVANGKVLGAGHNYRFNSKDFREHAEMRAMREALKAVDGENFAGLGSDVTVYTTLEPCTMCRGAMALNNVRRVVSAATPPLLTILERSVWQPVKLLITGQSGIAKERGRTLVDAFIQQRDSGDTLQRESSP